MVPANPSSRVSSRSPKSFRKLPQLPLRPRVLLPLLRPTVLPPPPLLLLATKLPLLPQARRPLPRPPQVVLRRRRPPRPPLRPRSKFVSSPPLNAAGCVLSFFESCPFPSSSVWAIQVATTPPPATTWVGSFS